jgi:hypothetical protein
VDEVQVGEAEVRIRGRLRPSAGAEPVRVLAFAGRRFLAAGRPSAGGGFRIAGWVEGPKPDSPAAPVRVFAIAAGRALELPRRG